jgi:hypothetical protein
MQRVTARDDEEDDVLRIMGLVLLAVLLAFICGLFSYLPVMDFAAQNVLERFNAVSGDTARRAIEVQFGVTLPASVDDVRRANLGDSAYWFRLDAPREAMSGLFRGSAYLTCNFPLQTNYRPTFQFPVLAPPEQRAAMNWWNPDIVTSFVGGECTGTDYKLFRMFISTEGTTWTLYLEIVQL